MGQDEALYPTAEYSSYRVSVYASHHIRQGSLAEWLGFGRREAGESQQSLCRLDKDGQGREYKNNCHTTTTIHYDPRSAVDSSQNERRAPSQPRLKLQGFESIYRFLGP